VFTHFFIEAMEKARSDKFGVTLEEIWEYARGHTQSYTSRSGRPQTPQKMISKLTSSGPLYFSFPRPRDAVLAFGLEVGGKFLVRYESGQLTELVTKQPGSELRVPMYPGEIVLERLKPGARERRRLAMAPGATIWVRKETDWSPKERLGAREEKLTAKGENIDGLVMTRKAPGFSGLVDAGYRAAFGPEYSAVSTHNASLGLRVDYDWLYLRLSFAYGRASEDFQAWGYTLDRFDLRLEAGPCYDFGDLRLALAAEAYVFSRDVVYSDEAKRPRGGFGLGAGLAALYPLYKGLYLFLRAGIAAERASPVAHLDAAEQWNVVPWMNVGLALEVF
jgi:hypothetical protein